MGYGNGISGSLDGLIEHVLVSLNSWEGLKLSGSGTSGNSVGSVNDCGGGEYRGFLNAIHIGSFGPALIS